MCEKMKATQQNESHGPRISGESVARSRFVSLVQWQEAFAHYFKGRE